MVFGVGVLCRSLYAIVSHVYVSCSGSIASVREERIKSAIVKFETAIFFLKRSEQNKV